MYSILISTNINVICTFDSMKYCERLLFVEEHISKVLVVQRIRNSVTRCAGILGFDVAWNHRQNCLWYPERRSTHRCAAEWLYRVRNFGSRRFFTFRGLTDCYADHFVLDCHSIRRQECFACVVFVFEFDVSQALRVTVAISHQTCVFQGSVSFEDVLQLLLCESDRQT